MIASPNLNLFDERAHAVTLYLYPLVSPLGFEQTSVSDLLEGESPPGLAGPRVPVTVAPGESRVLEEAFPQNASHTGILADYYRAPGDPEGTRHAVVPARCGRDTPRVTLSAHDLLVVSGSQRR